MTIHRELAKSVGAVFAVLVLLSFWMGRMFGEIVANDCSAPLVSCRADQLLGHAIGQSLMFCILVGAVVLPLVHGGLLFSKDDSSKHPDELRKRALRFWVYANALGGWVLVLSLTQLGRNVL